MRRSSITAGLVALACAFGANAGTAGAVEYAHQVGVEGGANFFGPFVSLIEAETIGLGSALGCAGIRGITGVVCETEPGTKAILALSAYVNSEPYIHNHSTFKGTFDGFYY